VLGVLEDGVAVAPGGGVVAERHQQPGLAQRGQQARGVGLRILQERPGQVVVADEADVAEGLHHHVGMQSGVEARGHRRRELRRRLAERARDHRRQVLERSGAAERDAGLGDGHGASG